jgi:hypothetical protein
MRTTSSFLGVMLILSFLGGCYPHGAEYNADLDLVYTNYSSGFTFNQRKTFAIPDSVIKITGAAKDDPDARPSMLSATYSDPILNQLKDNLTKYGWTQVDKNASPDVIILASAMTTTNVYYYYDWDYWDWWYPGFVPTWGWYYPGYYYPPYVTSYRTGSVFVQMVDQASVNATTGNVPIVWNCILNGLAEGSTSDIIGRIQTNINQAFAQSPYLKH